jgi:hypothetical protein
VHRALPFDHDDQHQRSNGRRLFSGISEAF